MTTAARAIELRAPLAPAPATAAAVGVLRSSVPGAGPDRWLAPELETAAELLASGAVVDAVNATIGPLL
jgi:histidine ammonia-lyase